MQFDTVIVGRVVKRLRTEKGMTQEGLIVTSNYYVLGWGRRRCDRKVTPFFCVHRLFPVSSGRKSQEAQPRPRS